MRGQRVVSVPGLPDSVEVRVSSRRRRSVTAFREGGRTVVVAPERMSRATIATYARELVERLERRERRRVVSDEALLARAATLSARYLDARAAAVSVRWVGNQRQRWGSCTPADGAIRLSDRLIPMPDYVIDYVLLHELCHLLVADHGPRFTQLMGEYPQREQAQSFLAGYELAQVRYDDGNDPVTTSEQLPEM